MADDLNKNITISVTADTSNLEGNITTLNKTLDSLLAQQKQLDAAGQQNSATYSNISDKINALQKTLKDAASQLNSQTASLGSLSKTASTTGSSLASLNKQLQGTQKAAGNSASKTKDLSTHLNALGQASKQQKSSIDSATASLSKHASGASKSAANTKKLKSSIDQTGTSLQNQVSKVKTSKSAFEGHKATMDLLKTSFDNVKDVSGEFGPSLQDAAQGFNAMKTGLSIVQGGLKGVGEAIQADGFDFLLQILQYLFDAFVKSSKGSKILHGAISAIGVVVNEVKGFFNSFLNGIISAISHPIDSIKSLGKTIEQNIINRFKAFGVILDGIIHLDFKKIANGAIQAFSGVTDVTDKIGTAFTTVKDGVASTTTAMVKAYTTGYDQAGQAVDKNEKKVKESVDRQKGYYDSLGNKIKTTYKHRKNSSQSDSRQPLLDDAPAPAANLNQSNTDSTEKYGEQVKAIATTANAEYAAGVEEAKKKAQQLKDFEIQTAQQVSTAAFSILQNSIKQQSEAKVAALEKDKNNELNNSSLTSAQRLAIQAKYKKQEDQVKKEAFKEEQEASIAQAVINSALAVTKATSQTGTLAPLVIPGIIAETAIEIAKIASQKPPAYASGGLHYTSDGRGGMLPGYSRTDNTNAYLRSGEGIVVSEAMRDPWARNLVSAINVGFGGRDFSTSTTGRAFAVGGVFTDGGDANRYYNQPVTDNKNLANSIAYQMVNNFPPVYVDVKDINNQQNILAQTINRVNL